MTYNFFISHFYWVHSNYYAHKKENLLGCLVTEKMDGRLLGFVGHERIIVLEF